MDLKSKKSIEIMLVLAIIFVAIYAIIFSIGTPTGESKRPVTYKDGGGAGGSESAFYIAPVFNSQEMTFNVTIIDPKGVLPIGSDNKYSILFWVYDKTIQDWDIIYKPFFGANPVLINGTPFNGVFELEDANLISGTNVPLTNIDCDKGFYFEWTDNNNDMSFVGNNGVLYANFVLARQNSIPFAGECQ